MSIYHIQGGRVIDPANGRDQVADLWIEEGKIRTSAPASKADQVIDATGKIVAPGMIDMHVHLREPGQEAKETIATGTRAAAAGGFTSVCCIPNTSPVCDTQTGVKFILAQSQQDAVVNVYPYASVTREQKGEEITEFGDLLRAGAVGFTDDGRPVMNNLAMMRAMEYSRTFDALILDHCEDWNLGHGGVIREGELATRLGLPVWPAAAESIHVARDVSLAELTGARVHIMHVSTQSSLTFIRNAKERGVKITCEVTPHHLALNVERLATYDTSAKCNPPLSPEADRQALIAALLDGTIDVIATDHAPHTQIEKDFMFTQAPNGLIGMETALAVLNATLIETGVAPLPLVIEKLTSAPARLLRIDKGTLSDGADADLMIFDPKKKWTVDADQFQSKARNCPWHGEELTGQVEMTFVGGRPVWQDGRIVR